MKSVPIKAYDHIVWAVTLSSVHPRRWLNFNRQATVGDLVQIFSHQADDWLFSWVIKILGDSDYLLKSVKTNEIVRYQNISICPFADEMFEYRKFGWNDAQFAFHHKLITEWSKFRFSSWWGGLDLRLRDGEFDGSTFKFILGHSYGHPPELYIRHLKNWNNATRADIACMFGSQVAEIRYEEEQVGIKISDHYRKLIERYNLMYCKQAIK